MNQVQKRLVSFAIVFAVVGCAPKVYLNDRQTVLEEEAAGEWPEFEKELLEKSKSQGPTPFSKADSQSRNNHLYQVLNGEPVQKESKASRE
jgi:hypothetical protein